MYNIDLHTHSHITPDGGLRLSDYEKMLTSKQLDYIAITDHNQVDFALKAKKALGRQIIVGEEINTGQGEIIGLYLKHKIEPFLGAKQTVRQIKRQNGLVYIPHPFEKIRRGLQPECLETIIDSVDIIEIHNGRAYVNNKSATARTWAKTYQLGKAASSDAHGSAGWGKTFSIIASPPSASNLVSQLKDATYSFGYVGPRGALYPVLNRLKSRLVNAG